MFLQYLGQKLLFYYYYCNVICPNNIHSNILIFLTNFSIYTGRSKFALNFFKSISKEKGKAFHRLFLYFRFIENTGKIYNFYGEKEEKL